MPAGMGKRGTCPSPSENVVKCFCALVVTAKRSVDELFMHYFHNQSSTSGGLTPTVNPSLGPTGDFCPDPKFAHPWKKSRGRPWEGIEAGTR